jgi:hypothetical protein
LFQNSTLNAVQIVNKGDCVNVATSQTRLTVSINVVQLYNLACVAEQFETLFAETILIFFVTVATIHRRFASV